MLLDAYIYIYLPVHSVDIGSFLWEGGDVVHAIVRHVPYHILYA